MGLGVNGLWDAAARTAPPPEQDLFILPINDEKGAELTL